MGKWEMVRLGDVGTIITGSTPKTSDEKNYLSKDLSFFKPGDIAENTISLLSDSESFVSNYARSQCRLIPPNSVLVTCIGIIGKIGITVHESTCNQQINAIIPDFNKCDSGFLAYAISRIKQEMNNIANAAVVPIINKSQFSNIQIPLPPLPIQQKIADILDRASTLIEKRKAQIEKLDLLVKSRFVEMFGDPVTNPMGWEVKKLSELSIKITDGVHAKPHYTNNGMPFISVVNITKGFVDFTNCKYVSILDYEKMIKSTKPEYGDILYTKVGATYGIPAFVDTYEKFCLYVSVCLIKPNHSKINARFLTISMGLPYIKQQADERIRGIGVPDLHLNQIREFNIICPPFGLQDKYIDFVQQVDKLKLEIQRGLDKLELLYKSLMQKCFNGEMF